MVGAHAPGRSRRRTAWAQLGEAGKAVGFLEQRLAIARELGDRDDEAATLYNSALAHEKLGERDQALTMVAGRTKAHELGRLLPWTWKAERLAPTIDARTP